MRVPTWTPARPIREAPGIRVYGAVAQAADNASIEPAACCAEVCVNTPFGRICHCALDLPVCP
jgi:hypothetical protein